MRQQCLDDLPDVLKPSELPSILRLGRNTIYAALKNGDLPSIKVGHRILVPKAAIRRLLESADGADPT